MAIDKYYAVNFKIRDKELRVINDDGSNLGVLQTQEALKIAREKELDLVVIGPNTTPSVAKILDFKKFLYQERKKRSSAKGRSKKSELKEIRFGPYTGDGDINRHIQRAREFLSEGNRVKVSVSLRGRENLYPELAFDKIKRFQAELTENAKVENEAKLIGNIISIVFVAK